VYICIILEVGGVVCTCRGVYLEYLLYDSTKDGVPGAVELNGILKEVR
jgi:hypothetical protein